MLRVLLHPDLVGIFLILGAFGFGSRYFRWAAPYSAGVFAGLGDFVYQIEAMLVSMLVSFFFLWLHSLYAKISRKYIFIWIILIGFVALLGIHYVARNEAPWLRSVNTPEAIINYAHTLQARWKSEPDIVPWREHLSGSVLHFIEVKINSSMAKGARCYCPDGGNGGWPAEVTAFYTDGLRVYSTVLLFSSERFEVYRTRVFPPS